jgi:2',3'-cyclic-nucleotide 2'-phosphodiesterase (5'-nucleotidase family)
VHVFCSSESSRVREGMHSMNSLGNISGISYTIEGRDIAASSGNNAGQAGTPDDTLHCLHDGFASSQGESQEGINQKTLEELKSLNGGSSSDREANELPLPSCAANAISVAVPGPLGTAIAKTAIQDCQEARERRDAQATDSESLEESVRPESEFSFAPWPQLFATNGDAPVTFGIINTNDEHDNTFRKFPRETTIVRQREKYYGDDHSFIVNLGDVTYNGNTKEAGPQFFGPVTQILNSMNVEYFVPGNHDLDHGGKYLENEVLSHLKAKTLAGNLHLATGKPLEGTEPYRIEEIDGVKVGFIGLTTPKVKDSGKDPSGAVTVDPILDSTKKFVPEVRQKGTDVIVLMMHEGVNTARAIAASVPGIDMIIAGHDHKKCAEVVKNPDGRNTVIVEAGGNSNYVGDLTITVDPSSKKVLKVEYKLFPTSGVAPDREVADIIKSYK